MNWSNKANLKFNKIFRKAVQLLHFIKVETFLKYECNLTYGLIYTMVSYTLMTKLKPESKMCDNEHS